MSTLTSRQSCHTIHPRSWASHLTFPAIHSRASMIHQFSHIVKQLPLMIGLEKAAPQCSPTLLMDPSRAAHQCTPTLLMDPLRAAHQWAAILPMHPSRAAHQWAAILPMHPSRAAHQWDATLLMRQCSWAADCLKYVWNCQRKLCSGDTYLRNRKVYFFLHFVHNTQIYNCIL